MGIFEKPKQENPNDGIDQEKAGEDARKSLAREMQRQLTDEEIKKAPHIYRILFWETGMIGQVLYLEAEACGVKGTGIGCFFDDPVHDLLGLKDHSYQSLYHFTIGGAVEDIRLMTHPPYHHLKV